VIKDEYNIKKLLNRFWCKGGTWAIWFWR